MNSYQVVVFVFMLPDRTLTLELVKCLLHYLMFIRC